MENEETLRQLENEKARISTAIQQQEQCEKITKKVNPRDSIVAFKQAVEILLMK